jgi:hypothetical protein
VRTSPLAAGVVGTALLLTACGSSGGSTSTAPTATSASRSPAPTPTPFAGQTAEQVLAAAKAAAATAKSVHVKGSVTQDGETMTLDMTMAAGGLADGTMTVQGGLLTLRRIGQEAYMQGDKKFWAASGAGEAAALLTGKWIKMPIAQKDFGDFNSFTDLKTFVAEGLTPEGTVTRVAGKPIGGVETVGLSDGTSDGAGILYISTGTPPYPLLTEPVAGATSTDRMEFSDWDAAVDITAPPADEVVDIAKLAG